MNKKNIKRIAALVITATMAFSSCNINDNRVFVGEKTFTMRDLKVINLEGTEMQLNDTIWHPVTINFQDTLLFLKNRHTDYIFDIYNLNNNNKIYECLTIGQGPNEFLNPFIAQSMDGNVWIFDRTAGKLKKYTVSDLTGRRVPEPVKNISFRNRFAQNVAVLSNGTILTSIHSLQRAGFDIYDSNGIFLDSIGGYPEYTSRDLSDMEKMMSLRNTTTTNMTDRVFISYLHTDLIEIYDLTTGKCLKRMRGPHQIDLAMEVASAGGASAARTVKGETYKCYSFPAHAGDEVFVLYFGDLWEDYKEKDSKIIVFDWNGKPLRMYELDIPLFTLTVDYKQRIIYGLTDTPEFRVIKYNY